MLRRAIVALWRDTAAQRRGVKIVNGDAGVEQPPLKKNTVGIFTPRIRWIGIVGNCSKRSWRWWKLAARDRLDSVRDWDREDHAPIPLRARATIDGAGADRAQCLEYFAVLGAARFRALSPIGSPHWMHRTPARSSIWERVSHILGVD